MLLGGAFCYGNRQNLSVGVNQIKGAKVLQGFYIGFQHMLDMLDVVGTKVVCMQSGTGLHGGVRGG